jgi:hypothetical protein
MRFFTVIIGISLLCSPAAAQQVDLAGSRRLLIRISLLIGAGLMALIARIISGSSSNF